MPGLASTLSRSAGAKVIPAARPIRLDPSGAKEAVLLLHGFTGHPGELALQAKALAKAGYAVGVPRLPGHGTSRADFLATDERDWLRRAVDAALELRADYGTVHLLGHSMGGLLAALVASVIQEGGAGGTRGVGAPEASARVSRAPRLVLLAPAFLLSKPGFAAAPFVAPFAPVLRRGRPVPAAEADDPVRAYLHGEYRSDDLVCQAAALRRLQLAARPRLAALRQRILVVVGSEDASVPPAVGAYVERKARAALSVEVRELPGAGHVFPFDARGPEAAALVADWMLGQPPVLDGFISP